MIVLAIGAHFDDVELGCGGALARYSELGHDTNIWVATKSGFNALDSAPVRSSADARLEGLAASRLLGATLHEGGFATFGLQFNDELNAEVRAVVDRTRPDLVLSVGEHDVHSDHWALAKAVQNACRHVPRVAFYRCNWYPGAHAFDGRIYCDVSGTFSLKLAAIRAYESEWARVGNLWAEYFTNLARNDGLVIGVQYAECFEVLRWLVDAPNA